jgi:hypothetical protein
VAHHAFILACAVGISDQYFWVGNLLSCQENLVHLDRMRKKRGRETFLKQNKYKEIKPQLRGKEK